MRMRAVVTLALFVSTGCGDDAAEGSLRESGAEPDDGGSVDAATGEQDAALADAGPEAGGDLAERDANLETVEGGEHDAGPLVDAGIEGGSSAEGGGGDGSRDAASEPDAAPPPLVMLEPDPAFDEGYVGDRASVVTTLVETLQPRYSGAFIDEFDRMTVPASEFGAVHPQPGEPHLLRAQLDGAVPWTPGALPAGSRSVHFGLVIADTQFVDQESPVLVAKNLGTGAPAFRPHGEWVPALADALVRAANLFHQRHPIDFVYSVGDQIEDAQRNEMRWFLTLMEGGELSTDTGERDDVVPGPGNDAYDPFVVEGLSPDIPWSAVIGNHDILVNGNFPVGLIREVNETPDAAVVLNTLLAIVGGTLPGISTSDVHPAHYPNEMRPAFTVSPEGFELDQLPYQEDALTGLEVREIPADPERAHVDACDLIDLLSTAAGLPEGHGYTAEQASACRAMLARDPTAPMGGWYTHELVPGALRLLALALGPVEGGSPGILARPPVGCVIDEQPCRDDPRYDQIAFLQTELARAEADGVGVIVMTHQVSDDIVVEPDLSIFQTFLLNHAVVGPIWTRWVPTPNEPLSPEQFRSLLAGSGHVVAHIAGHNHRHQVRAVCPDGSLIDDASSVCAPAESDALGYWEITTSAVVDAPHQARFMEVVHVEGQRAALYLTVMDPRLPEGSMAERGRFLARAWSMAQVTRFEEEEIAEFVGSVGPEDRNVLLPFLLPEDVAVNWMNAEFGDVLASETTLREAVGRMPELPVWVSD